MARRRAAAPVWSRRKLIALLAGATAAMLLLAAGLVLAVADALTAAHHPHGQPGSAPAATRPWGTGPATGTDPRDVLADAAMPTVPDDAAYPGAVSTRDPGAGLAVPPATGTGPAGVPTGFPHSPLGALGQLAAIDRAALQSASLSTAAAVVSAWAEPGGPTPRTWTVGHGVADLLTETGVASGSGQLAIVLSPLMGLIKGTVGADFVIACVDFELDVTLTATARGATADCQRMHWSAATSGGSTGGGTGGRWLIGPGSEPVTPPAVWPDTDLAYRVGYRDLQSTGGTR